MTTKADKGVGQRKIDFVLDAPEAQQVFLAGTFNNWSLKKHPMKKNGQQQWKKTIVLPPGCYEYKFWVDGRWTEDPHNQRCCTNSFGTVNSIVRVPS